MVNSAFTNYPFPRIPVLYHTATQADFQYARLQNDLQFSAISPEIIIFFLGGVQLSIL